jgi:hypothetical protein
MGILLRLDECTELIKWDEGCDYTLLSEGSLGGISFSESEALAIANALLDDLGYGWISVNDKLPDKSQYVLVCEEGDAVSSLAWFNENGLPDPLEGNQHFWWEQKAVPADYWRPLPQPYGGE